MSPQSERTDAATSLPFPKPGDEVVISGIAGRFPKSDNLTRLKENLLEKRDLITDDKRRWEFEHPDIPQQLGEVNNIEKFDAAFFGVHSDEAQAMDPMGRMLLEHAYEAIIDAGVNPQQLRGTTTGVFIGSCYSESENDLMYEENQTSGFGVLGCSRSLLANRISNWLGVTGPSCNIDTACSASSFAMDHAYRAIRTGQCDAALVGASQLCLNPLISLQFSILGTLSADGRCKSFDADGNGYCRSEAICMFFLQKSKDAKRVYADIIYTRTNCDGFKEQGITFPSSAAQQALLEKFYEDCEVPPTSVAFLETHGTGTKAGDPVELNTLARVFCPGRTTPLLIGSVKSNLGHTEPSSGACSIAKVLIAMDSGYIPPNLHYNRPREEIEALVDGRLKVITEVTPWDGGYVGVNSFGFGGANAHILLKSNPKEKINNGAPNDDLPRLVAVSGRTQEAVETLLDDLESRPVDVEYISLFHNIHAEEIPGHSYRGFTILPPRSLPGNYVRDVQYCSHAKRQVWFVFSGKGSPWPAIGKTLLKIPIFFKAAQKCDVVLKPYGVDVIDILATKDPKIFNNILNSLIGMATIQIGLVDVLVSIGIVPDHIIGHSIGELGCAYANGCLTVEEILLAAYYHGLELMNTGAIPQSLAVVDSDGMNLQGPSSLNMKIDWHGVNGSSAIGVSSDTTKKTAIKRQDDDILDGSEPYDNIAYQSCNIRTAVSALNSLACFRKLVPDQEPHNEKWLRSSTTDDDGKSSLAELFSSQDYTNNTPDPISFDEISHVIPKNSIVIEITPQGLFQTVLRSSSNQKFTSIASASLENQNPLILLLQAIGEMYELGLRPQLANLYPAVQHPVSRGTPMISPLVRWEHSDDWFVSLHKKQDKIGSGERVVRIDISDDELDWMAGHVIDGKNLVPATGYLVLVWETLALMRGDIYETFSVVFEDIKFHRMTVIPKEGSVELTIMIQKGSGRFEIAEQSTVVVTGFIRATSNPAQERLTSYITPSNDEPIDLTDRDIYKELHLRGYHYKGLFRVLTAASLKRMRGVLAWKNNWGAFIDGMLQLNLLGIDTRALLVPKSIQKLVIDIKEHLSLLRAMPKDDQAFAAQVHQDLGIIVSGGVEVRGLGVHFIGRKKTANPPVLEKFEFVAHRDRAKMGLSSVTRMAVHIALENHSGVEMKTVELIDCNNNKSPEKSTSILIHEILGDTGAIRANVNIITPDHTFVPDALPSSIIVHETNKWTGNSDALLVISHGVLANKASKVMEQIRETTKIGGFLLAREPLDADDNIYSTIRSENLDIIVEKRTDDELVFLLRETPKLSEIFSVIQISNHEFSWLSTLQTALRTENKNKTGSSGRILIVSESDFESGLMGLVNCLRREQDIPSIQGLLIQDLQAPKFSLENPLYFKQLDLGLALNVLRPGKLWGSYRFFPMDSLTLRPVHNVQINQLTRGDLSSLKWVQNEIQPSIGHTDIIQVHYSSVNFRDVMASSGKLSHDVDMNTRKVQENVLGFEYSGRDSNGRAVMGMICGGAFSNTLIPDSEFLWPVPDSWTLEDAATVPLVYSTAYVALKMKGGMKKGDKVLIHAGSGGVGQAAITLALHEQCEVFTTVGTPGKRAFIKKQFPQIDNDHIGNSRSTSFEQLVLRKTHGRGVDIVLNSLADEKLQASIRCLRKGGRFVDIGKFDYAANHTLGMEVFLKGISFQCIYLDKTMAMTSSHTKKEVVAMLAEGIKTGAVKPLVRTVFTMDQVEAAFRYMAAGKHIGKVILKIRDETNAHQAPALPLGLPRYHCAKDGCVLILGGLGGFGLELANWLVLRGAKKLVLASRKGITTGYQRQRVNIWESNGVKIVIIAGKDASTYEGCTDILKESAAIGPLDAIFNLAVVVRDSFFENQTIESFEESFRAKAWATKQLDKLSRIYCPQLRKFVVFSSLSCGRGNPGQTNYGMSNSVMERICEKRVTENLPGLAIQWGPIGDVGLVTKAQQAGKEVDIGGTVPQEISSCLQELEGFLLQDSPVVSSAVIADKIVTSDDGPTNIVEAVTSIMGLKSLEKVSLHSPLMELGLDSMMAIDIKMTLEREFQVFLSLEDIRSLNFREIEKISSNRVGEDKTLGKTVIDTQDDFNILLMSMLSTGQPIEDVCVPLVVATENDQREVFLIPGTDGTHVSFKSMANKLKRPTTCLQFSTTSACTGSIHDVADYLMPHVKARSKGRRDFEIVGYSFGSLVAIELVRRLESEGFTGRLVIFDGSPDYLKAMANQSFKASTDDALQTNLLLRVMDILTPYGSTQLASDLKNRTTWEEKLAAFTSHLPKNRNSTLSLEDLEALCTSIYHRIKAIWTYDFPVMSPLKTPVVLLRPKIQTVRLMSEDYGLQSLTREKVEVYYVEGTHRTMLDDEFCAATINRELA